MPSPRILTPFLKRLTTPATPLSSQRFTTSSKHHAVDNVNPPFTLPERRVAPTEITVIGSPVWHGQPVPGAHLGPDELRIHSGLIPLIENLGHSVYDYGDVPVPRVKRSENDLFLGYVKNPKKAGLYNKTLAEAVERELEKARVLHLGGDHSTAIGSVCGHANYMDKVYRDPGDGSSICVLWVDAHADINTPFTSPSGNGGNDKNYCR